MTKSRIKSASLKGFGGFQVGASSASSRDQLGGGMSGVSRDFASSASSEFPAVGSCPTTFDTIAYPFCALNSHSQWQASDVTYEGREEIAICVVEARTLGACRASTVLDSLRRESGALRGAWLEYERPKIQATRPRTSSGAKSRSRVSAMIEDARPAPPRRRVPVRRWCTAWRASRGPA